MRKKLSFLEIYRKLTTETARLKLSSMLLSHYIKPKSATHQKEMSIFAEEYNEKREGPHENYNILNIDRNKYEKKVTSFLVRKKLVNFCTAKRTPTGCNPNTKQFVPSVQ